MARVRLAWILVIVGCAGGGSAPQDAVGPPGDRLPPERDLRPRDRSPGDGASPDTGGARDTSVDERAVGADAHDAAPIVDVPSDAADASAPLPALPFSCDPCATYGTPRPTGNVAAPALNELSGLAASRVHKDVFYAINDDDDHVAQVFTLDLMGTALGQFVAQQSPRKIDTEEVAVGPCPGGSCVYVADAGDAGRRQPDPRRSEYALHRMREPASARTVAPQVIPSERFRFAYPDGSHDSEAMVIDPRDGTVYMITKVRVGATAVYALPNPLAPDTLNLARKVRELPIAGDNIEVTAASAHPCGVAILVRTYSHVYEFRGARDAPFVALFSARPTRWATPLAVRAEAITYQADGRGYVTAPEGIRPRIVAVGCQ